jgi:hypothetical protein
MTIIILNYIIIPNINILIIIIIIISEIISIQFIYIRKFESNFANKDESNRINNNTNNVENLDKDSTDNNSDNNNNNKKIIQDDKDNNTNNNNKNKNSNSNSPSNNKPFSESFNKDVLKSKKIVFKSLRKNIFGGHIKELEGVSGVYKITSIIRNKESYIGSSINLYSRIKNIYQAINGAKVSEKTKALKSISNNSDLEVTILYLVPPIVNIVLEQYAIILYKPEINTNSIVYLTISKKNIIYREIAIRYAKSIQRFYAKDSKEYKLFRDIILQINRIITTDKYYSDIRYGNSYGKPVYVYNINGELYIVFCSIQVRQKFIKNCSKTIFFLCTYNLLYINYVYSFDPLTTEQVLNAKIYSKGLRTKTINMEKKGIIINNTNTNTPTNNDTSTPTNLTKTKTKTKTTSRTRKKELILV